MFIIKMIYNGGKIFMATESERKDLIIRMNKLGVTHMRGKNPYTMSIGQLETFVKWLEDKTSK